MNLEKQIAAARIRRENKKLKTFMLALAIIQIILFCLSLQCILAITPSPVAVAWYILTITSIFGCLAAGGVLPGGDGQCK